MSSLDNLLLAVNALKIQLAKAQVSLGVCADKVERKFVSGASVELTAGAEGKITGYATTPALDAYHHRVAAGAFTDAIKRRGLLGPTSIKLLLDHDWTKPAGVITILEYRSRGLWLEADLDLSIQYVRERWSVTKMLGGVSYSVGLIIEDAEVIKEDGEDVLLINKADLLEVSVVLFPANEEATMSSVKGASAIEQLQAALAQVTATNQLLRSL